jgi:hypothetical protein
MNISVLALRSNFRVIFTCGWDFWIAISLVHMGNLTGPFVFSTAIFSCELLSLLMADVSIAATLYGGSCVMHTQPFTVGCFPII